MPNSNPVARRYDEAICSPSSNCKVSKTYHGPRFTPVGKQTPCDHHDTRIIEGYDRTPRGRIDAEVCTACDEVLSQKIIR